MNMPGSQNRFARKAESRVRLGITRGQALVFLFVAFALFFYAAIELVFAPVAKGSADLPEVQPVLEVTVRQGDSLWKLAAQYREKSGLETAELIEKIIEKNNLDGVIIHPGQTLAIPLN